MVFVSLFSGVCALLPAHGLPAISMAGLPASGVVYPPYSGGQFSVNSLFHNEFYPFLLKAVLGKFLA
jgi:hypothetical protein